LYLLPAEIDAASRDTRRLGVPVTRIALADSELTIEAWHSHADEGTHRWTDEMARLPEAWPRLFPGAFALDVHLAGYGQPYRLPPPTRSAAAA
jgi:hypothetical protein